MPCLCLTVLAPQPRLLQYPPPKFMALHLLLGPGNEDRLLPGLILVLEVRDLPEEDKEEACSCGPCLTLASGNLLWLGSGEDGGGGIERSAALTGVHGCVVVLQAALKKYQTEQRSKGDALDKCQAELKKLRKKSQGSKNPQKYSDKELQVGRQLPAHGRIKPQAAAVASCPFLGKEELPYPPVSTLGVCRGRGKPPGVARQGWISGVTA